MPEQEITELQRVLFAVRAAAVHLCAVRDLLLLVFTKRHGKYNFNEKELRDLEEMDSFFLADINDKIFDWQETWI
jgi:hypothetical protein